MGVILLVLGLVFAVNLGILGYSVKKGVVHQPSGEEPSPPGLAGGKPGGEVVETAKGPAAPAPAELASAAVVNPIQLPESGEIQSMYVQHCAACHGLAGHGDGPASNQLYPRPRDFTASPFRFAPRGGGPKALIPAIERTISQGVPRSSMPGFKGVLSEPVIAGLARYVSSLRAEQAKEVKEEEIEVGIRPPTTPGLLSRGQQLFVSLGCIACHGDSGHGNGPSARTLVDSVGRPVRPADLTSGLFKSGQSPEDLCRVVLKGIPGTPMASFEPVLTTKNPDGTRNLTDAWALVAHVQSLKPKAELRGEGSGAELIVADAPDEAMLLDPGHLGWLGIEPIEIAIKPLWQREETITHMKVRAVRTSENFALCLEWHDDSMNVTYDQGVFPDAAAVMFAMGKEVPALPMGVQVEGHKAEAPVDLWHWKADRQWKASEASQTVKENAPQDSNAGWHLFLVPAEARTVPPVPLPVDPSASVPSGCPVLPSYRSAEMAGNIQALPPLTPHSVLESNALGFGTLTPQPPEAQNVWGAAAWSNGFWRVVMVRPLNSADENDIKLEEGSRIPVTFAIWDGAKEDRDGIKLISGWHWLVMRSPSIQSAQTSEDTSQSNGEKP
jgi:cytochrome c oxidase cbb3-type subunit 2